MQEIGKVSKTEGKYAIVKVQKKDECSKCGMCLFPKNASEIEFRAKNTLSAKEGDDVLINTSNERGKLVGMLLVFLVPLLLIGLAVLIEKLFIKNEIFILPISIGLIVVWFFMLSFIDKKIAKNDKYVCEIIEILNKC